MTIDVIIDKYGERLDAAADQLRAMRINNKTIYEAVETKVDVERLIRRIARDLRALKQPNISVV